MTVQGIPQCACHIVSSSGGQFKISHRMVRFGRDLWSPSTPLLKKVHLEQVAQDHIHACFVVQFRREVSAQQRGGISPHFAELDPTSAIPGFWRSQMALMKNIMGSTIPVPTQHHSLSVWQRCGRCCSKGELTPAPAPHEFSLIWNPFNFF